MKREDVQQSFLPRPAGRNYAEFSLTHDMIRSLAFTTKEPMHSRDIDLVLMSTLLLDTNLFLRIDLEAPTREEVQTILESVFHFHPLPIADCVHVSSSPKVEDYSPREN